MEYLFSLILAYRYAILLPLAVIEGPIVIIIAAFIASLGYFDLYIVYIIGVLGDIIGDIIYYWIGRLGGHTIIPHFGKYVGITDERLQFARDHYKDHLGKTIIIAKIIQAPILLILVTAGILKVNFLKYLNIIVLVTLVKVLVIALVGFYFGKWYASINNYLNNPFLAVSLLVLTAMIFYLLYYKYKKKIKLP
jgi:membrane protein DedA with SNARE-associated domain